MYGKAPANRCKIRWFVYCGGEKIRHTANMRGRWIGWDAECTVHPWASNTGGAIKASVDRDVWDHKYLDGES